MTERTILFAKAYIRAADLRSVASLRHSLQALRALDAAMMDLGQGSVAVADANTFNLAAQKLSQYYAASCANSETISYRLKAIAAFLHEHGLAAAPLSDWDFPRLHSRSRIRPDRAGPEFERRRQNRLPDPEALAALPKAYRLASDPRDIIVTSAAAILCASPGRINELLVLAADCETEQKASDGRALLGLRWAGSKGAEPHIKWILPGMTDVVRHALERIRTLTESARLIARWYERNPSIMFLPEHLKHLRNKHFLELDEVGDVIGLTMTRRSNALRWLHAVGLPISYERRRGRAVQR